MKEMFSVEPEVKVIEFNADDVIRTGSGCVYVRPEEPILSQD